MKAKRLKEILLNVDDDFEVFIRNSVNPMGDIRELEQVEQSSYGFFGSSIPCLILNTDSSKGIGKTENDEVVDYIANK